jgi:hypothetical protein
MLKPIGEYSGGKSQSLCFSEENGIDYPHMRQ